MAAYGKRSKQYFQCDSCGVESSFDRFEGCCTDPDCGKELCRDCLLGCQECNGEFCEEHFGINAPEHVCQHCCNPREQNVA